MSDKKKERLSSQNSIDDLGSGNQIGTNRPGFMHRRSLIKASVAAVPTIMTLRSGGAIAATSMQCDVKDAAVTDVPNIIPASDIDQDSWVRAPAQQFTNSNLNSYKAYVGATSCTIVDGFSQYTGTFINVNDIWFVGPVGATSYTEYTKLGSVGVDFIFCGNTTNLQVVDIYVLCYVTFDANGHIDVQNITYFPDDPNGGQQITESCACSIDPTFQITST